MATHSGILAWKIPWTEEPSRLKSIGLHRVRHNWSVLATLFMIHFLYLYMTTGKTIDLTIQTFVGKVMSLGFNTLSTFTSCQVCLTCCLAFLPRSKHLLVSWLQSPSAVILEPKKIKSLTASIVSPSVCHEVIGPDAVILAFWMLSFKPTFTLLFHFHQEAL